MLLNCIELDTKLVLTTNGDTHVRAKIVAKYLQQVGRSEVPVGLGLPYTLKRDRYYQEPWVHDYDLTTYPNVYQNGIERMVELIMASEEEVVVICIGPMRNVYEALKLNPNIVSKSRIVCMLGSVRVGYQANPKPFPEYNVVCEIESCREALKAYAGKCTLTPLDTCGNLVLQGELYQRVLAAEASKPIVGAILENFRIWFEVRKKCPSEVDFVTKRSSILFDTLTVYSAFTSKHLKMEELYLKIEEDGLMVETTEQDGYKALVAVSWEDNGEQAFYEFLVDRLLL